MATNEISDRLCRASPSGRLEAHEAAVEAMRADGFDCDQFNYRWQVEAARAEMDRGGMDQARVHLAHADHALTSMNYLHDKDRTRGVGIVQAGRDGAAMTNAQHSALRERRFARLRELLPELNLQTAAAICESEGMGSADAIIKQWNRHKSRTPPPLSD